MEERAFLSELVVSEAQEEQTAEGAAGLTEYESAACVDAPTMVSLRETEDASTTTMEILTESLETPSWLSSAQTASLANTLTALTLAGVPVVNTTLDSVLQSLRMVVTVTTASLGEEIEFTLRTRSSRPPVVESSG